VDSLPSEIPYHRDLKVKYRIGITKVKKLTTVAGLGSGDVFLAYNSTTTGCARALNERLFFVKEDGKWIEPYEPPLSLVKHRLQQFACLLDGKAKFSLPLDRLQFASKYQARKKERYLRAASTLEVRSIERKDFEIKFFMKMELYNMTAKPDPAPRGINPPTDVSLLETGRHISPIEKSMYIAIAEVVHWDGAPAVMKGLNQEQRGKIISGYWGEFSKPVCLLLDASRFEQSVTHPFLEWEIERYLKYYPNNPYFRKLMRSQLNMIGKVKCPDGKISFKKRGGRSSGQPNTALGNCLISAALLYSFCLELGICKYRMFLDGDDCGIIMDQRVSDSAIKTIKKWYKELGFRLKVEKPVTVLEEIDFCQSRPVWTENGYVMVRNLHTSLCKDAVSTLNLSKKEDWQSWISAIGQGGISLVGGIPVVQNYYRCCVKASNGAKPAENAFDQWHMENKYKGMKRVWSEPHPESRCSFWKAFGVTPDEQIELENYYDELVLTHGIEQCNALPPPVLPGVGLVRRK